MFEHEGNWTKALEHYDLLVQSGSMERTSAHSRNLSSEDSQPVDPAQFSKSEDENMRRRPFKGLIRSLQQIGCTHVLDVYCQGLASQKCGLQRDLEFTELQVGLRLFILVMKARMTLVSMCVSVVDIKYLLGSKNSANIGLSSSVLLVTSSISHQLFFLKLSTV